MRALGHGLEDLWQIGRRGRDHAQHVANGSLLRHRLGERAVASLVLLAQGGILVTGDP
jgi:hypothetical protein